MAVRQKGQASRLPGTWDRMRLEFVLPTLNLSLDYYSLLDLYRYYYTYSTYVGTATRHNYDTTISGS